MSLTTEYAACDDDVDGSAQDSIEYIDGNRTALVRLIKDPIHDYIPVHILLSRFVDTRQFQRLRDIKQLGAIVYVWPGATHSRFEHSLGVAYLSRLLASRLQKNQPELGITDRDVDCVEVAGLCHDLGHGPWSHMWDGIFIPKALPGSKWKHEYGSEMMFDSMISEYGIPIPEKDRQFIKALIAGDHSKCSPEEKRFLFDIVANKRNGLDVDKFDYIERDSQMIGEPIHISSNRIVNSARVIDEQICYDIKDANQLYEICATRFKLHKIIYSHKTARAIEYMIIDALLAAEPYLRLAERIFDPEKLVFLNDSIKSRVESSEEKELELSRSIFRRIQDRDFYKCVDYKVVDWYHRDIFREHVTSEKIMQEIKLQDRPPKDFPGLSEDDVIVDFSTMHYGMKEKNPLAYVKFYSKRNPSNCRSAENGDYSNLRPDCFAEILLRIYTKKQEYWGRVQAGYRKILEAMDATISADQFHTFKAITLTPPASEPSTTPVHDGTSNFSFGNRVSTSGSGNLKKRTSSFTNNEFTSVPSSYSQKSMSKKRRAEKD